MPCFLKISLSRFSSTLISTFFISMPVFSSDVSHVGKIFEVGNGLGQSTLASGKAITVIHQDSCNYSIGLLRDQHVKFNLPDVIFLESKIIPDSKRSPHLVQAEMPMGYDWHFEENSYFKSKWFGLMCEGVENFDSLRSDGKINSGEDSPQLQFVNEANNLACPATLTDKGWVPNSNVGRAQEYVFEELVGANWSGFIVGFKGKANGSFSRINFCMVHERNVLMGTAVNTLKPLWLNQKAFDEIEATLRTVEFLH